MPIFPIFAKNPIDFDFFYTVLQHSPHCISSWLFEQSGYESHTKYDSIHSPLPQSNCSVVQSAGSSIDQKQWITGAYLFTTFFKRQAYSAYYALRGHN